MKLNARQAAVNALGRCRKDAAWSGAVTDNLIKNSGLDKREASLAARLCLGVLQNYTLCDFYISCYCPAQNKLEPKVRDILRLGIYQLLFTRIPPRAAVNETVSLCATSGCERASGLVNAVLRKVSDNLASLPEIPNKGSAEHLSIKYSHPKWLADRLIAEHGYAFTEAFFASNNQIKGFDIQVNTLRISADDYGCKLDSCGIAYNRHPFLPGCFELTGGAVTALPGFDEGLFYVQDSSARAAAYVAGAEAGMCVLDACAAPGGKTFASAIMMGNEGRILSCDIHDKKLSLIRQGAERLGINIISTACADGRKSNDEYRNSFDLVIADVPCSGLGVIGKKPEIRRKKEEEIANLPVIQADILRNLANYVKPGGRLLYSTCTVLPEENENLVRAFLSQNKDYKPEAFSLGEKYVESGMYTFWPHIDSGDGFFVARLVRNK